MPRFSCPWLLSLSLLALALSLSPAHAHDEPAAEAQKAFVLIPGWESKLALGVSGSSGNSEAFNFAGTFDTKRATDHYEIVVDAAYFRSSSDGTVSKNQATVGAGYKWLFPDEPWFLWAEGRYDWDDFKDFDWRWAVSGGLGYHLIQNEKMTLDLLAGIGVFQEVGSPTNDDVRPEGVLGADFTWKVAKGQELTAGTRVYPDLDETGEFRSRSTLEYAIKLSEANDVTLTLGLLHEYRTLVSAGQNRSDLTYYLTLGMGF